jgi:hypothetical protein
MRIQLDITDAIQIAVALSRAAHNAIKVAEEFPESEVLVKASESKFALMNRYRQKINLDALTVEELKEKYGE